MGMTFFQPNAGPDRPCPICGTPRPHSPRYPNHVCATCVERAVDGDGRPLEFFNPELLGGFAAAYRGTGERLSTPRDEQECRIDGVRCLAREAHFGGIVVEPVEKRSGQ
jgi:ADP-ribosyl-[dinitrogen reductase] hydrolase